MGRKVKEITQAMELKFDETTLSSEEQKYRNETLSQSMSRMFKDLSGREPTYEEVIGQTDMHLDRRILRRKGTQ